MPVTSDFQYRSYILRFWTEKSSVADVLVCRFLLQDSASRTSILFTSKEALLAYLDALDWVEPSTSGS